MPTNSNPKGRATNLLVNLQADYATPAAGDYVSTLFYAETIAETEDKQDDAVLGLARVNDRDQTQMAPGLRSLSGGLTVPLDVNHIGLWLYGLFGAPETTGTGPYTHVFESGAASLPYLTIEFEKRKGAAFFQNVGLVASSMALSMSRDSGYRQVELQFVGRNENKLAASAGGTPAAQMARQAVPSAKGLMRVDGVDVAELVGLDFNYANNPTADESINGTDYNSGYDLDETATCNGSVTLRYKDETFYDRAVADSAHAVDLVYQIGASASLTLSMPAVRFARGPIAPISGPGGLQAQLDWSAEQSATEAMLTATLVNSIEDYFA
nr:phage tail tube protein [uncultured Cohaesibacter sp.]